MANNIQVTQGTGTTIATEQGAGTEHYQKLKLIDPTAGSTTGIGNAANPIIISGAVTSGATDSGNPVKIGGVYNSTAPALASGQRADLQLDASGNTKITNATLGAGEDLGNNVTKVEERFNYASYSTGQTGQVVKSSGGFLHAITFWSSASSTLTIWDNTTNTGTTIVPATPLPTTFTPFTVVLNINFNTGLTFTTSGATILTFSYR